MEDTATKSATKAYMDIIDSETIINPNILQHLDRKDQKYLLVIFHLKNKLIRLYPLNSAQVYKLVLVIEKLLPNFIGQVGSIYIKYDIDPVFSSALCFFENYCTYEAFISPDELHSTDFNDIKSEFEKIFGVKKIYFKEISLDQE